MKKYKLSKKIMIGLLSGCLALTPSILVNAEEGQDIIINEEENQKVEETETDVTETSTENSENESLLDETEFEELENGEIENAYETYAFTNQVRGFVERLYTYILNRPADANGLKSWTNVLVSGKEQGAKVAQGFIQSPEFLKRNLSDTEYIKILYKTFLNREADAAGLKAWQNVLNDGLSRMHVFKGFAESDEFTRICQSYGIIRGNASLTAPRDQNEGVTKFVVRCYRKCLGREADENGLNNWCTEIISGKCTAKEAAYGFFFSDEFQKKNLTNTEYVKTLYQVMMNREADTSGLNAWVKVLEKGKSRAAVFNDFGNSDEFQKICAQYGIKSGKGIFEVGQGATEQQIKDMLFRTTGMNPAYYYYDDFSDTGKGIIAVYQYDSKFMKQDCCQVWYCDGKNAKQLMKSENDWGNGYCNVLNVYEYKNSKGEAYLVLKTWVRLARSFTSCQIFGKNQNGNIQSIYDSMLEDMTNESCVVNNNGIWLNESVEITNNGIDFDKIVTPVRITITNGIVNREVR